MIKSDPTRMNFREILPYDMELVLHHHSTTSFVPGCISREGSRSGTKEHLLLNSGQRLTHGQREYVLQFLREI